MSQLVKSAANVLNEAERMAAENDKLRKTNTELSRENDKLRSRSNQNLYICRDGRTWMDNRVYERPYFEVARTHSTYDMNPFSDNPLATTPFYRESYQRIGQIGPFMVWEQVS